MTRAGARVLDLPAAVARRADESLAAIAERLASAAVSEVLGASAEVRVAERPFARRAVRGRYPRVEVRADGLQLGPLAGAALTATLRDVRIAPRELLARRVRRIDCGAVSVSILLPYAEVARASRVPGLGLRYAQGRIHADAAVPVPGVGSVARVHGRAELAVDAAGRVRLALRDLAVADGFTRIPIPLLALNALLPALEMPLPMPPLPFGLRIDGVIPTPTGLAVLASAPTATVDLPIDR